MDLWRTQHHASAAPTLGACRGQGLDAGWVQEAGDVGSTAIGAYASSQKYFYVIETYEFMNLCFLEVIIITNR